MMAIRAARAYTGRPGLLRFDGAYHGTSDAVATDTSPGVPAAVGLDVAVVPFDDEAAFLAALDERGEELACVLLDLMPNRAGLRRASESFARLVRDETARREIVLIVDEVITFRLSLGGVQEVLGIVPDLVTFGKIIGGGFPVGAFGGRAEIMEVFDPRGPSAVPHGGTFSANPVTMRAGLAALRLLDEPEIERLNELGERLLAGLREAGVEAVGRGSLLQLGTGQESWWRLYKAGVLVAPVGLAAVSTPMDESIVDEVLARALPVLAGVPA